MTSHKNENIIFPFGEEGFDDQSIIDLDLELIEGKSH